MTNELRKTLGRNMRYASMNEQIDNEIAQLKGVGSPEAQMRINALQQQRDANYQQMQQPMTAQEYAQYDDNGYYVGEPVQSTEQPQNTNGFRQMVGDGITHLAQGTTLGWSDEAHGVMGGVKRMYEKWRDNSNPDIGYLDTFTQGYRDYRDASREELKDAYRRNPIVSAVAELSGVSSVPKFAKAAGYVGATLGKRISHPEDISRARWLDTIGTGIANGLGITNHNTVGNYTKNIMGSTFSNALGTMGGNALFGSGNDMHWLGREVMNGTTQTMPYVYDHLVGNERDE